MTAFPCPNTFDDEGGTRILYVSQFLFSQTLKLIHVVPLVLLFVHFNLLTYMYCILCNFRASRRGDVNRVHYFFYCWTRYIIYHILGTSFVNENTKCNGSIASNDWGGWRPSQLLSCYFKAQLSKWGKSFLATKPLRSRCSCWRRWRTSLARILATSIWS